MDASANISAPPARKPVNWAMLTRVGLVVALVLGLVGYALKVTYESVIQGGVVNAGDHYQVDLWQMSKFEMSQDQGTLDDVPERFRKLDGQKVLLQGEVAPGGYDASPKVNRFQICYSVAKCCVGTSPKVQHFVDCRVPGGKLVTNYVGAPGVRVFGTLHVKMIRNELGIESVYQMDVERVEPVS